MVWPILLNVRSQNIVILGILIDNEAHPVPLEWI